MTDRILKRLRLIAEVPRGILTAFREDGSYVFYGESALVAAPILGMEYQIADDSLFLSVKDIEESIKTLARVGKTCAIAGVDPECKERFIVERIVTPREVMSKCEEGGLCEKTR